MGTTFLFRPPVALWLALSAATAVAQDQSSLKPSEAKTHTIVVQSQPGANAWNAGRPPADWWAEIRRQHGHVGPWNVLGWRIGQAALRELNSEWGRHEFEVVCYVPLQTPFTCMVDGLAVGTGASIGRLDLRLAEVFCYRQSFVAVRCKGQTGAVLEFRPNPDYLKTITNQPIEELERLSLECGRASEAALFSIHRIEQ